MNALAREKVGDYITKHFVCAVQKVATFRVAGKAKQGGNVAAYFCTPERLVLHAVAGPVDEATFLREAHWAVEAWNMSLLEDHKTVGQKRVFFRQAHFERLRQEHRLLQPPDPYAALPNLIDRNPGLNNQGKVHLILCSSPLAKIESIYRVVFEKVLKEKISTNPVVVAGK